jgi:hypothetical protein
LGEHIMLYNVLDATVPLDQDTYFYQYGFVFDADGDGGNNYVPLPEYPKDFFVDTDRWYVATYDPAAGWTMDVTNARDGALEPVASAARIVLTGNAIILVVPSSEFEVTTPAYRLTAFRHVGDWGASGEWSADVVPTVDEGLHPFGS